MSIVKAIILLLFATLPNFAVVSSRLALAKGIKLKGSSLCFQGVTPANLTTEFSVKCFAVMQPLIQDITAKKNQIDQCDEVIRGKEQKLSDLQAANDQLQLKLAVSEAVVKEKERHMAHQQDLYTTHKNNSLVKDELLTALRAQIASQATKINEHVEQIERLQREANEAQEQLKQFKTRVDQVTDELQGEQNKIHELVQSLKEKDTIMQNVSAQLSICEQENKVKQIEIEQLQTKTKEAEDKLGQCQITRFELNKELTREREQTETKLTLLALSLQEENMEMQKNASAQISKCEQTQKVTNAQLESKQIEIEQLQIKKTEGEEKLSQCQMKSNKESEEKLAISSQMTQLENSLQEKEIQLENLRNANQNISQQLSIYKSELKVANGQLWDYQSASCYGYGNSSAIHQIRAPGIASFNVRCESRIVGPGWTVIQRRINGTENFYRNWTEYRDGFGDLNGEFFIGLEKLYRMTLTQSYELYVQLETFNASTLYARYSDFSIASESDSYALLLQGKYTGTAGDGLFYAKNRKFSTYDADNDRSSGHCAVQKRGAWWYDKCGLR